MASNFPDARLKRVTLRDSYITLHSQLVAMNLLSMASELNQSCEELRLFGHQELSDKANLGLHYFVLGYNIVLFPLSLSLTALIIFLIIKFKHLQLTTFFLALQVVISDFLFILFACSSYFYNRWTMVNWSRYMQYQWWSILQFCQWIMFVFVCDRFSIVYMLLV